MIAGGHFLVLLLLLAAPSFSSAQFTSYARTPFVPITNATVAIHDDFDCSSCPALASNDNEVLVMRDDLSCFPHQAAEQAFECGYVAVLCVHNSPYYDLNTVIQWAQETDVLPVYQTRDVDIDWENVESLTISHTDDLLLKGITFKVQVYIFIVVVWAISLEKLRCALIRLWSFFRVGKLRLTYGTCCLLIESVTSVLAMVYFTDPSGVFGALSYPLTAGLSFV